MAAAKDIDQAVRQHGLRRQTGRDHDFLPLLRPYGIDFFSQYRRVIIHQHGHFSFAVQAKTAAELRHQTAILPQSVSALAVSLEVSFFPARHQMVPYIRLGIKVENQGT